MHGPINIRLWVTVCLYSCLVTQRLYSGAVCFRRTLVKLLLSALQVRIFHTSKFSRRSSFSADFMWLAYVFWTSLCPPFVSKKLLVRARRGAVRWGTALQAGRSGVRFPVGSLGFFTEFIFSVALGPSGSTPEGGKGGRCIGLTTSYVECLEILGVSTSWSAKGLSRPVPLPALQVHGFHFFVSVKFRNIST